MYNILCDSIGLTPASNNGTLRLPLKPVGLHEDVPPIEVPSDPVTSYSITSTPAPTPASITASTASMPSPSAPEAAQSVGSDPVVEDGSSTSNPVQVDKPEEEAKPGDSVWDWAKDAFGKAWTWTTGKAEEVWGKIQGDAKGDSVDGSALGEEAQGA